MAEYIANYAFELINPVDDQHGGYGELPFSTDKPIETAEDWKEVARQCFLQGNGTYSRVNVLKIGEILDDSKPDVDTITGDIIE